MTLEHLIEKHVDPDGPVGADGYRALIRDLVQLRSSSDRPARILEVGGGRTPMFTADEVAEEGFDYWVNDVSQTELSHLPSDSYSTACFDVAGEHPDIPADLGTFDLIFSRSLLEHVANTDLALANCRKLLAPSGFMVHSFPTLWNPVFVANLVLPERISAKILSDVVDFHHEKFPALYHRTTSGAMQQKRLLALGLQDVAVVPFWGHGYFHFVPRIARTERRFAMLARRRDWRWYSTFCFIAGQAPPAPGGADRDERLAAVAEPDASEPSEAAQ